MNAREKLILVLVIGILLRLLVMPHTQHPAAGVKVDLMDELFLEGFPPILRTSGFGTSFYLFYAPMYLLYGMLQSLGLGYNFVLYALFKIPPLIGNLIIFYSLYEILRIETGSKDTAFGVSAFYLLNPYVIFIESWVGHAEQLSVSFILLSFLFLARGQSGRSGLAFAFSAFSRYIPLLLLPAYLGYIWANRPKLSLGRFAVGFLALSVLLASPYLFTVYGMYRFSPQLLFDYFAHFFSAVGVDSARPDFEDFAFNFTGFLATLGLFEKVRFLYGAKGFLTVYLVSVAALLWWIRKKGVEFSIRALSAFSVLLYTLFLILIPLQQHHYLSWLLPFLFLASGFSMVPGYFITILWGGNLLLDPITGGGYKYALYNTISNPFRDMAATFYNLPLRQSISALMGFIVLMVLYLCLKNLIILRRYEIKQNLIKNQDIRYIYFSYLFFIFWASEIFKIVYSPRLYTDWFSLLFGGFVVLELIGLIREKKTGFRKTELFPGGFYEINLLALVFLAGALAIHGKMSHLPLLIVLVLVCLVARLTSNSLFISNQISTFLLASYLLLMNKSPYTYAAYALFALTWTVIQLRIARSVMLDRKEPLPCK